MFKCFRIKKSPGGIIRLLPSTIKVLKVSHSSNVSTSDYRDVVHCAATLLHDHIREFCHFDLCVVALFHQVHHWQRRALHHGAFPLSVTVVALRLFARASAPECLVPCWFDDPVLGPREGSEVNEVLFTTTGWLVGVGFAVATCPVVHKRRRVKKKMRQSQTTTR